MKKPYNETWVNNLAIQQISEKWRFNNLISHEQNEAVKVAFPEEFYRPGIFVKIGLFVFACIACSFFIGFIALFILDAGSNTFGLVSVVCCLCFTFFLEFLIKDRKLFHSGVDNALLYSAIGASLVPVFMLFENLEFWQYCICILAVLCFAAIRYADLLVTASAFVTIFTLLSNLMMKFPLGKALLPFGIMILAVIIYFSAKKIRQTYYRECRIVLEVLSLITLYLGGNYYVVREGNALLSDLALLVSPQIPFASVFYFFTLIIPLIYIFLGLRKKDRILLLVGLFALAFSIFTYRYYFGIFTLAQGLALAGIFMVIVSILCIRYLKEPKSGITDEPDGERKMANMEALIAAQYLGQTPQENGIEFGGGNFGGGGAGNTY